MFRWFAILTICTGLSGCISVTNPPSQSSSQSISRDSEREIAELRREIRSLRDSMNEDGQNMPNASRRAGEIDLVFVEELLRSTSRVASMSKVTFTKPDEYSEYNILDYGVDEGEDAGANGLAFVERHYGSRFEEYRDYAKESCRENGNEFFDVNQDADSDGEYGTMSFIYACLSRSERVQMIGRSETLFLLDGGYGIGYTEVIPYLLSYRDALGLVRDAQQTF